MSLRIPTMAEIWTVAQSRGQLSDAPNLWRGLVGAWPGQEGGGTILHDVSGHGNHGTLTNMDPATDWVVTERGRAPDFDGSNDRIVLAQSDALNFDDIPFSLAAWVNVITANVLISRGAGSVAGSGGWYFSAQAGLLTKDGATNAIYRTWGTAPSSGLHHLASVGWYSTTVTDGYFDLYADGQLNNGLLVKLNTTVSSASLTPMIACRSKPDGTPSSFFGGTISNVLAYSRALLPWEIQQDAADPLAKYRLRRRVYAVGAVGAPPTGNRRRRMILFGAGA